jgi:hypothetical protein
MNYSALDIGSVIGLSDSYEKDFILKILKLGINCSPLQNTPYGYKVIELIKQMEEGK